MSLSLSSGVVSPSSSEASQFIEEYQDQRLLLQRYLRQQQQQQRRQQQQGDELVVWTQVALGGRTQQITQDFNCLNILENVYFNVLSMGYPMISVQDLGDILLHSLRRGEHTSVFRSVTSLNVQNYHIALVHGIEAICLQRMGHRRASWLCFQKAESIISQLLEKHFADGADVGSTWHNALQKRRDDMRIIVFTIITMARFLLSTGTNGSKNRARYMKYALSYIDCDLRRQKKLSKQQQQQQLQQALDGVSLTVKHAAGVLYTLKMTERNLAATNAEENISSACEYFKSAEESLQSNTTSNITKYPNLASHRVDPIQVKMSLLLKEKVMSVRKSVRFSDYMSTLEFIKAFFIRIQGQLLSYANNTAPDQFEPTQMRVEVMYLGLFMGSSCSCLLCVHSVLRRLEQITSAQLSQIEKDCIRDAIYKLFDLICERTQFCLLDTSLLALGFCEPDVVKTAAIMLKYHLDRVVAARTTEDKEAAELNLPPDIVKMIVAERRALVMFSERYDFVEQLYSQLIQLASDTIKLLLSEA